MKKFLIVLYLSYACSDKLDLTYLPPPGSQYAGGRPEDIQTPLEYPKQTYSTTLRPPNVPVGQKNPNTDDYQATIGINRLVPSRNQGGLPTLDTKVPSNNYQNNYNVPSTTVSYAFTQTTTHPPAESFETTISPINPITGLPINPFFNTPSQEAGQVYQGSNNQFPTNAPGYEKYNGDRFTVQPTPESIPQFPGISNNRFYGEQNLPGQPQFQQSLQQSVSGRRPGFLQQSLYPGNETFVEGYNGQPGFTSSTKALQDVTSAFYPAVTTDRNQGFTTATAQFPQKGTFSNIPNVYQPDTKITSQNKYDLTGNVASQQQYPGYPASTVQPNQKISTGAPTKSSPGFGNQQFTEGGFTSPGIYNGGIDTTYQGNIIKRPERPQAEADRNAVILNYKNVITPEGEFEYSFDTSNGIHADENGTAIDGVKAEGSYSYTGDDGKLYTVVYTADENGFRPRGDHLPTPPPVPEAIQRVIEKVKQEKEAGIFNDGSYDEDKYGHKKYHGFESDYPLGLDRDTEYKERDQDIYSPAPKQGSKKQFNKYQSSLKKPITDIDDFGEPQELTEEDKIAEGEFRRPSTKRPSSRPSNRISNTANLPKYQDQQLSAGKTAERPVANVNRNQNQQDFPYDNDKNLPSYYQRPYNNAQNLLEKIQQHSKYSIDDGSEPENFNDETIVYKGDSRRPQFPKQQQNGLHKIETNQKPSSGFLQNRNEGSGPNFTRRPITGSKQDNILTMFDDTEDKKQNRLPSDRPVTSQDQYEKPNQYSQIDNRNKDGTSDIRTKINNLPVKYPTEPTESISTENYTSFSQTPLRFRPSAMIRPSDTTNMDQIISIRRRPSRPGLAIDYDNQDNQGSIDDISANHGTENGDVTKVHSYTTPATKERYETPQDYELQNQQSQSTKRPQGQYPSSRDKFQRPTYRQPTYQNEGIDEQQGNVKYGQRLRGRPAVSSSTDVENNKKVFNSTGYQYIPPRNRFNYDEENNYSTRYPVTSSITAKIPSQQKTQYNSKDTTAKPFMTPNVSRVETQTPEDDYDEEENLPNQQRYSQTAKGENYEQNTTPDQIYRSEVTSTRRPSSQSTVRPSFQETTRRPQYKQQYSMTSGYKTSPEGTTQDNQTPYEVISSTTPVPSRRPSYYPTTPKEILIPGQKNVYYSEDSNTQRRPINNIISYSTPSSEGQVYDASYPTEKTDVYDVSHPKGSTEQYHTSYRPNQPTTLAYDETTASRFPNARPTSISNTSPKEGVYGNLPSTTYRPNYRINGNEASSTAGPQVDDYGRPVINFDEQGYNQQYTPASPVKPGDDQHTRSQFRPNTNGIKKPTSDQNPKVQGYQSSTERIIGEDFSGPKQQQRFDPKLGYYY